jgi:hypothetical protein
MKRKEHPMENARLAAALPMFVQQVLQGDSEQDRPLTVQDLRLGIRSMRMLEISGWSNHDLDVMEVHAAQFDGKTHLESVLGLGSEDVQTADAASVSSICAPSPFAWT